MIRAIANKTWRPGTDYKDPSLASKVVKFMGSMVEPDAVRGSHNEINPVTGKANPIRGLERSNMDLGLLMPSRGLVSLANPATKVGKMVKGVGQMIDPTEMGMGLTRTMENNLKRYQYQPVKHLLGTEGFDESMEGLKFIQGMAASPEFKRRVQNLAPGEQLRGLPSKLINRINSAEAPKLVTKEEMRKLGHENNAGVYSSIGLYEPENLKAKPSKFIYQPEMATNRVLTGPRKKEFNLEASIPELESTPLPSSSTPSDLGNLQNNIGDLNRSNKELFINSFNSKFDFGPEYDEYLKNLKKIQESSPRSDLASPKPIQSPRTPPPGYYSQTGPKIALVNNAPDLKSTSAHEYTHYMTDGDLLLPKAEFNQFINNSNNNLKALYNEDPSKLEYLMMRESLMPGYIDYLLKPTEIHARLNETRLALNPKDPYKLLTEPELVSNMDRLGGHIQNLITMSGTKSFVDLYNKMFTAGAVGLGLSSGYNRQSKDNKQ